jgi:hypothetical protein
MEKIADEQTEAENRSSAKTALKGHHWDIIRQQAAAIISEDASACYDRGEPYNALALQSRGVSIEPIQPWRPPAGHPLSIHRLQVSPNGYGGSPDFSGKNDGSRTGRTDGRPSS